MTRAICKTCVQEIDAFGHHDCPGLTTSPSSATDTDEDLVASIMAAIEAAPPSGGLSLTYGQVERGVRAALAALLRENKVLREALLTAQLLTVAHRKRVEDKLDAILQALGKPGENG
jgi:hypothetical protein